jgi:hypothetical protein
MRKANQRLTIQTFENFCGATRAADAIKPLDDAFAVMSKLKCVEISHNLEEIWQGTFRICQIMPNQQESSNFSEFNREVFPADQPIIRPRFPRSQVSLGTNSRFSLLTGLHQSQCPTRTLHQLEAPSSVLGDACLLGWHLASILYLICETFYI